MKASKLVPLEPPSTPTIISGSYATSSSSAAGPKNGILRNSRPRRHRHAGEHPADVVVDERGDVLLGDGVLHVGGEHLQKIVEAAPLGLGPELAKRGERRHVALEIVVERAGVEAQVDDRLLGRRVEPAAAALPR